MNLWLATIFRDIYGFVNCRDLSDKLGCIRSSILLLRLVLSAISRNIFNQVNKIGHLSCSILQNSLHLRLTMRKCDVEYALQRSCWRFIINTAFEVFDHRFQRSADVFTIEILLLRLFLDHLFWLQSFFHILNRSMEFIFNLRFLLNYLSIVFCNIDGFGHILLNRFWSRSVVSGDILGSVCWNCYCDILLNVFLLGWFFSYVLLNNSSGEIVKGLILCYIGTMEQVFEINNIFLSFLDISLHNSVWVNILLTSFFICLFLKFILDSLFFSLLFHFFLVLCILLDM